jgi:hypothetical protein
MEKWAYQIAGLLLTIYRDSFGFLSNKNYMKNQKTEIDFHSNFANLFSKIHDGVIYDVFKYYKKVLPEYFRFCRSISVSPLDKYNCLDNLCQNFTNNSLKTLVRNNIIFFSPFDVIYNIKDETFLNKPNLNSILEPYLILVDERLKTYLEKKAKKEQYLEDNHIEIKSYFNQLKLINIEKPHYSVFLAEKKDKDLDEDEEDEKISNKIITTSNEDNEEVDMDTNLEIKSEAESINESNANININEIYPKKMPFTSVKKVNISKISKEIFDFYFLFNLYFNFTYQTMKEMKMIFVNYDIIKRYIASIESSVTISFNDYDKTIIKSNQKGGLVDVKKTKKNTKKSIIKDLTIMSKLTRMARHMNYIFREYVNKVINDIIMDSSSRIAQKNSQDEKYYIKIGHYIINFLAYEKNGEFYNSYDYYKKSDICKTIEDDSIYLDSLNMNNKINEK